MQTFWKIYQIAVITVVIVGWGIMLLKELN